MMKFATLASLCLLAGSQPANACISFDRSGKGVETAAETAIIVWDSRSHREEFIRQAQFVTNDSDLGFLVPTPTVPTLTKADPDLFATLDGIVQRSPETHQFRLFSWFDWQPAGAAPAAKPVRVLSVQDVGGYEATILDSSSSVAVEAWLSRHGYRAGDRVLKWLAPYTSKHWVITAFRVSAGGAGHRVLGPVRMSFKTARAFYPYREPAEGPRVTHRTLRVFVLSDREVSAKLGGEAWQVKPEASIDLSAADQKLAVHALAANGVPGIPPTHLTSFLDSTSPRVGTHDVWFEDCSHRSWWLSVALGAAGLVLLVLRAVGLVPFPRRKGPREKQHNPLAGNMFVALPHSSVGRAVDC